LRQPPSYSGCRMPFYSTILATMVFHHRWLKPLNYPVTTSTVRLLRAKVTA
jgi:hypothetical protein